MVVLGRSIISAITALATMTATETFSKALPATVDVGGRAIPVTLQDALSVMHDIQTMVRMSPLIIDAKPDPSQPAPTDQQGSFIVTEKLNLLGDLIKTQTSFKCKWNNVPDGADAQADADAGTGLNIKKRLTQEGDHVVHSETVDITALIPAMPFVRSTMKKAHIEIQDMFIQAVVDKVKANAAARSGTAAKRRSLKRRMNSV